MKVLHLPTSTGGNAWGLSRGERALGLRSEVLVSQQTQFCYPSDVNLDLQGKAPLVRGLSLAKTFLQVRGRYDVFHFNFGSSLLHAPRSGLNQAEIALYPRGVKLFATYNGCDARQKFPTMKRSAIAACHNPACYGGQCNSGRLDELRREGIRRMGSFAQHMWAVNPDLLYFLPPEKASFLPYALDPTGLEPLPWRTERRLRIVHAPTNREAKGSGHILAALERLKRKYPESVEVLLVENVSREQAVELYREADLAIDQILIGWYGGFAVEAMWLGRPVIARIAEADLHFLPADMARDVRNTIINADPDTIDAVLERCMEDRAWLLERAHASLEYVRRWHDPVYVAGLTKKEYEA
jgi:hypothetical protein